MGGVGLNGQSPRRTALLLFAGVLLAGCVHPKPAPALLLGDVVCDQSWYFQPGIDVELPRNDIWEAPAPETVLRYFPPSAWERARTGTVVLQCTAEGQAAPDCAVTSEEPSGGGFANAAKRVMAKYKPRPDAPSGKVPVRVVVSFSLHGPPQLQKCTS